MKTQKLFLVILILGFYSCAVHQGNFNCSTSIQNGNFVTIRPAEGSSTTKYILGLGGLNKDKLVFLAKENLYKNANLQKGQAIANVAIDNKYTYILPIFIMHKVYLSADIIEFTNNNETIKTTIDEKPLIEKLDANKIIKTDTSTIYTKDLQLIKIGSWVEFSDLFGLKYNGTVVKIYKKAVAVKYYTGIEGYNTTIVRIKKIKKIN